MKTIIYVPDIECDSCKKLIAKSFSNTKGISSCAITDDHVAIEHDKSVSEKELIGTIQRKGFRAALDPFSRKTIKERMRHMKEHPEKYAHEKTLFLYGAGAFVLLCLLELIAYVAFLKNVPGIEQFAIWALYLNISVVTLGIGTWHVFMYRTQVTCMVGMMIGMTIGMQTGMLIGAVLGATNGFFIGAMTGMLLGVAVGIVTGKCCGVMGIMEGMMAGVMGGTMGPMISVMMFSDHLLTFMPVYIIINVAITFGLSYMLYEEMAEGKKVEKQRAEFSTFSAVMVIVTFILLMIMIYGPRSPLFSFGG